MKMAGGPVICRRGSQKDLARGQVNSQTQSMLDMNRIYRFNLRL